MGSYIDLQALKKKIKKTPKNTKQQLWPDGRVQDERQAFNQKLCPTHML